MFDTCATTYRTACVYWSRMLESRAVQMGKLREKVLVCHCLPGTPCHADSLIEVYKREGLAHKIGLVYVGRSNSNVRMARTKWTSPFVVGPHGTPERFGRCFRTCSRCPRQRCSAVPTPNLTQPLDKNSFFSGSSPDDDLDCTLAQFHMEELQVLTWSGTMIRQKF